MDYAPLRILYVDDDPDSLEVMQIWLRHDDDRYAVTAVPAASDALKMIEKERFDLFILDYRMPEVDGADLCYMIKKSQPHTPVMIYSANAREDERAEGLRAGADEFLIKPNDFDKLVPTVRRLLNIAQEPPNQSNPARA